MLHFLVCTRGRRARALTLPHSLQRLCRCATLDQATPVLGRAAQWGQGGGESPGKRHLSSRPESSRGHRQAGKAGVGPCWFRRVILGEILPLVSLRSPLHITTCTFSTLQPKQNCSKYPADKAEIQLEHLRHYLCQQWKIHSGSPIDSSWLVPSAGAMVFSS